MKLFYYDYKTLSKTLGSNDLNERNKLILLSYFLRVNTLYSIQMAGSGHVGSSLSALDIFLASFYYKKKHKKKNLHIFSSKGHDAPSFYNVLILFGYIKFELIHELRKKNGLPGHPDISINQINFNTGSLGMGISKGNGLLFRSNKEVIILLGDGELQEGQNWESFRNLANSKNYSPLIFIDSNKIQSDTWVSKVSNLGDLKAKIISFGLDCIKIDGHDLSKIYNIIQKFFNRKKKKPLIVICDTQKSSGIDFAETKNFETNNNFYKYHSGALEEKDYKNAIKILNEKIYKLDFTKKLKFINLVQIIKKNELFKAPETKISLINDYSKILSQLFEKHKNLFCLDADLAKDTGCHIIQKMYPKRFIEFGISEQDMVSFASGLTVNNRLPLIHSFACFLTTRAHEQIFNFLTEKRKGIFIGCLAGVTPAGPGHSHQMTRDISIMSSMPNLTIFEPLNKNMVKGVIELTIRGKNSLYLRLTNTLLTDCFRKYKIPKKGEFLKVTYYKKSKSIIIFQGAIFINLFHKIKKYCYEKKISIFFITWINQLSINDLKKFNNRNIIIYENGTEVGGISEKIKSKLFENNIKTKSLKNFSVNDIPICGTDNEVLKYYKFDDRSVINYLKSINE